MDNRRLFIAALLSLSVLVIWQVLFPPPEPAPAPQNDVAAIAREADRPAPGSPPAAAGAPASAASTATDAGTLPAAAAPAEPIAATTEQRTVVDTLLVRAEFTNRGAQLVSLLAKGPGVNEPGGLEVVRERGSDPYPFALVDAKGASLPINQALFTVSDSATSAGRTVVFRYAGAEGTATKTFEFLPNGTFRVTVDFPSTRGWAVLVGPGLRNLGGEDVKSKFARRALVYLLGDSVERVDAQGADGEQALPKGLAWVGLQDTYFITALIPEVPLAAAIARPVMALRAPAANGATVAPLPPKAERTKESKELAHDWVLSLEPEGERFVALAYFGPKQYDRLAALSIGLERSIDWGMFGILARFFRWSLQEIHDRVVPNYGWAIVLMTVLIKIVLLPLTHKSYVSMKKMQELNPKITAIRERWRPKLKDKHGKANLEAQRKMQEEMNALFKAEGASPISGCLPIVLQMPILFAFYNLLSTAVELRGAPWTLWIHDLSVADPYYVLPIVMGATQLIQQRMMPQAGDPMQRRLFQLMPILFTVLFLGFPAGLVLYWLVNNVLSIAQQAVYNHLQKRQTAA